MEFWGREADTEEQEEDRQACRKQLRMCVWINLQLSRQYLYRRDSVSVYRFPSPP